VVEPTPLKNIRQIGIISPKDLGENKKIFETTTPRYIHIESCQQKKHWKTSQ